MALFGSIATVQTQAAPAEKFTATFAYLNELFTADSPAAVRLRELPAGETKRIELSGGVFALEQAYFTRVPADGFFESHRKFIDVQVVFDGEEWMEIADIGRASVRQPYNPERDLIVYHDGAGPWTLHIAAGQAAVFYPADVHRPGMCGSAGPKLVRKTVIKVPV